MLESIVTYHATEVSPHEVQKKAEELYAGGFFFIIKIWSEKKQSD